MVGVVVIPYLFDDFGIVVTKFRARSFGGGRYVVDLFCYIYNI